MLLIHLLITFDLTGDGIDDEVKVGEKSIVITNGATGKKYFPVKGERIVDYLIVDNFLLVMTGEFKIYVYLYDPQKDDFVVKEEKVMAGNYVKGSVFETIREMCQGYTLVFVWIGDRPSYVLSNELTFDEVEPIGTNTTNVSAGSARYINPLLRHNEGVYLEAYVEDKDIYLYIEAGDCGRFDIGRIKGFRGHFLNSSGHDERIQINFDNSYSIFTSKTITYILYKFSNPYIVRERATK
jgi:hypothetical protein